MVGITGSMSGGKTYTAVEIMLSRLRSSHRIVTNIKLKCQGVTNYLQVPCVIWKKFYYLLENDDDFSGNYNTIALHDYKSYPEGQPRGTPLYDDQLVYIFLDEISSVFDSMISSADGGIQAVAAWARHTEKRGQIVYLIMQFSSELHKRLRVHITEYLHCTNSGKILIPFTGLHLPKIFHGNIIRTHYLGDGETMVGSNSWNRLDSRIYDCYSTGQIVVGHTTEELLPIKKLPHHDYNLKNFKLKVYKLWLLTIIVFIISLFISLFFSV